MSKFLILTYHRILSAYDPLRPDETTVSIFETQLRTLARLCRIVPLAEALDRQRNSALEPRTVCITFDDGYEDNFSNALPILRRFNVKATFFVASGFIDGGRMWNDTVTEAARSWQGNEIDLRDLGIGRYPLRTGDDRRQATGSIIRAIKHETPNRRRMLVDAITRRCDVPLPTNLMMSASQVRGLTENGMTVGAHTVSHPILKSLGIDDARREIRNGRAKLESITGEPITLFAYPNGRPGLDYDDEHAAIVREEGFDAAVSTRRAMVGAASDRYQLPRIGLWDRNGWKLSARLLSYFYGLSKP